MEMVDFVHLSFYRFMPFSTHDELIQRRAEFKDLGSKLKLKGTILLAPEGINAMISGDQASATEFKTFVQREYGVEDGSIKEAFTDQHAFVRYLVKIKKEIISMGFPNLL